MSSWIFPAGYPGYQAWGEYDGWYGGGYGGGYGPPPYAQQAGGGRGRGAGRGGAGRFAPYWRYVKFISAIQRKINVLFWKYIFRIQRLIQGLN